MSDANDILENVISDVKLSRDEWRARAEAAEKERAAAIRELEIVELRLT